MTKISKVGRVSLWDVRQTKMPFRSDAETVRSFAEELMGRPRERLMAVAAIFDGVTRVEAAMNAGVTAQTVRDWVMRFNENGPDGLIDF